MTNLRFEQFAAIESSKFTQYKHFYVDMCDGDLIAGILLARIIYWFGNSLEDGKPRVRHRHNGKLCLVKRRSDWWDECRVSERQFDRCIKTLKELGYINTEIHKSPFHNNDTAIFIFINPENIMNMVLQLTDNKDDGEPLEGNYQTVIPALPNGNSTITNRGNLDNQSVNPSYITKSCPKSIEQQQQEFVVVVDEKRAAFSKDDLYFSANKFKKDWTSDEIEYSYKAFKSSKSIITDPLNYIEGVIKKQRLSKQHKENSCQTTTKSSDQKEILRKSSAIDKPTSSVKGIEEPQCQKLSLMDMIKQSVPSWNPAKTS